MNFDMHRVDGCFNIFKNISTFEVVMSIHVEQNQQVNNLEMYVTQCPPLSLNTQVNI